MTAGAAKRNTCRHQFAKLRSLGFTAAYPVLPDQDKADFDTYEPLSICLVRGTPHVYGVSQW
jgi:hypothetical protein